MVFCGIVTAGCMVPAVRVPVGIATGGLTGDAPAMVDMLAASTTITLALALFLAVLLTGVGAWRAGLRSRGVVGSASP